MKKVFVFKADSVVAVVPSTDLGRATEAVIEAYDNAALSRKRAKGHLFFDDNIHLNSLWESCPELSRPEAIKLSLQTTFDMEEGKPTRAIVVD